jgi:MerR family transcriptional regulator, light-induced transcriptional regulator
VSSESPLLRIGALSRRVGVSPELLRAWEQRYGLLEPRRTDGGFRLYSAADEERVRSMQRHIDAGVPAAEAARLALAGSPDAAVGTAWLEGLAAELGAALDRFDEPAAQAAFDRLLATFTVETVLRDAVLPYLHELGARWERGELSVAHEHFASSVVRGRLLGLARGWGRGSGPRAVLACAPGEQHDLALIAFGLVLAARGWAITYLGADTPLGTIRHALGGVDARLVVVTAVVADRLRAVESELAALARDVPVALAGPGADEDLARATGATLLDDDPVTAAERVASGSR